MGLTTTKANIRPFPTGINIDPMNGFVPAQIYAVNQQNGAKTPERSVQFATDETAQAISNAMGGIVQALQPMAGFTCLPQNTIVFDDGSQINAGFAADLILKQYGYFQLTGSYVGQNQTYAKLANPAKPQSV